MFWRRTGIDHFALSIVPEVAQEILSAVASNLEVLDEIPRIHSADCSRVPPMVHYPFVLHLDALSRWRWLQSARRTRC